jgi:glycosyltransferase involved in cell wall biosynthesis
MHYKYTPGDFQVKISIITVVYNSAATIEDTIMSVAAQTYQDVEHIVVDGASTDGTLSVIHRHMNKIQRFISEPDKGIYDAMNKGIGLATGDVIGFLNADDIYADNLILGKVASVFADSAIDACYADLVYVSKDDLNKVIRYWKSQEYRNGLFRRGWMPAHPTFFVRKSVYDKYGGFDLDFKFQSDFDMTMRFLEVYKIKSVYIPEIFVKMRIGGATNRRLLNIIKGNIEAYRACRKNGLDVSPFFIVAKILSRIPQFFSRQ